MRAVIAAVLLSSSMLAFAQLPVEGNPASSFRVVIYEDLQCPDCADFRAMLDEKLLPKYGKKVAFEHRDFPLTKHAWARKAALAGRMMAEKDPAVAIEWRRYALSHIKEITAENFNDKLMAWGKDHGMNPVKLAAALDDKDLNAAIEKDIQEGLARGVGHTPTAFVDGEPFVETISLEEISAALDKAK